MRTATGLRRSLPTRLKISRSAYSAYENGANALPLEILIALADLYQVSVDYLLFRTDFSGMMR